MGKIFSVQVSKKDTKKVSHFSGSSNPWKNKSRIPGMLNNFSIGVYFIRAYIR